MIICVLCSSFQQLCVETPGSSAQNSPFTQELREEMVQFHVTYLSLKTQSSSVKKTVKQMVFSLKQKMSELRMADSVLSTELNLEEEFCLWPSQIWPNLTQDGTGPVWAQIWFQNHTATLRSEFQMVSFYWKSLNQIYLVDSTMYKYILHLDLKLIKYFIFVW